MSNEELSLYERIKAAQLPDGTLPEDFMLRNAPINGKVFADGAIDGTVRYHMGPTENADISGLTVVLSIASQGRFKDAANGLLTHFMKGAPMLPVIDAVQEWIYDNPEDLKPEVLGNFCRTMLTKSNDAESVKFALTVMEMLEQETDDELREIILTLAMSDELTLFCLFQIAQWDDAPYVIFELAKKLRGWGKIHAVSMLKPVSEEMEQWLLDEGWHNAIMDEYSAMIVIKRAHLADRLAASSISSDLFKTATQLISASLGDSPVPGIGKYKRGQDLLGAYISHAEKMAAVLNDYITVFGVQDFLDNLENEEWSEREKLADQCDAILQAEKCRSAVSAAMAKGVTDGFYLAKSMGMEFAEQAMEALRNDWRNSYDLIDLLLPEKLYVNEIVELFEKKLPLDEIATGPENEMGSAEEFWAHGVLSYIVQGMQWVPGKGEALIAAALLSPVIGCRNIALNTVQKWQKAEYPLGERITEAIEKLKKTEVDEKTQRRLENF